MPATSTAATPSKAHILSKTDQGLDIFRRLLGDDRLVTRALKGAIRNPWREDRNPSFSIHLDKRSGEYRAKDFANGHWTGSAFDVYMQVTGISGFAEALAAIASEFNILPPLSHPGTASEGNALFILSRDLMTATLKAYDRNSLFPYLVTLFGREKALSLCQRYHVGTTRDGRVIFWQVDRDQRVRSGKIMAYNPTTGKRDKSHGQTWVHKQPSPAIPQGFELRQCFWGEHLLSQHPGRRVAIVESEKTALIAEGFMPEQFIWQAAGSKDGLGGHLLSQKCRALEGRDVVLFPDLSRPKYGPNKDLTCFDEWQRKAEQIQAEIPGCTCTVSRYLEDIASEAMRQRGDDLGDWLPVHFTGIIPEHLIEHEDVNSPLYLPF